MNSQLIQGINISLLIFALFICGLFLVLMKHAVGQDEQMTVRFRSVLYASIAHFVFYAIRTLLVISGSTAGKGLFTLLFVVTNLWVLGEICKYLVSFLNYKEVPLTGIQKRVYTFTAACALSLMAGVIVLMIFTGAKGSAFWEFLDWLPFLIFNVYCTAILWERREKIETRSLVSWCIYFYFPAVFSVLAKLLVSELNASVVGYIVFIVTLYVGVQAQESNFIAKQLEESNKQLQKNIELQSIIGALALDYSTVTVNDLTTGAVSILKMSANSNKKFWDLFENKNYREVHELYLQMGVFPDDREYYRQAADLELLKNKLKVSESSTVIFRNEDRKYHEEKIVRSDDNTMILGFADKNTEILEEMEQKHKLEDALAKAEEASLAKSTFLFNMSHDIRTPMNAIIGYNDMALRHPDDHGLVLDSLHRISQSSEQLLALINDILDMSRIESGKMEVNMEPTSIVECMDNVRSMFSAQAKEKQIQFKVDASNIKHPNVMCDRNLSTRILMNLISNALKFTRENGAVSVKVEELNDSWGTGATYRIIVADNGIGMSPEFVKKIFEPFERERTSTVSKLQGTGLGMAIVGNIVKLLNGKIDIKSTQGYGSTFIIDLPHEYTDETPISEKQIRASLMTVFENKKVLLVEDMLINRELAKVVLQEQGISVEEAEDGQQAVDMFREHPERYDAILMDVQMPVMDGYAATKMIRDLDIPRSKTVPIIAMTANAFAEDKQRALESGMDDHIAKPIDVGQLNRTLSKYLR